MATDITKLIDLQRLSEYDVLIKGAISDGDALALKTVLWDSTNEQIKFYKKNNATLSDTPDYSVSISSSDVQNLQSRVGMSSSLNSYQSASNLTDIMNVITGDSTTAGSIAKIASDEADAAEAAAIASANSYTDSAIGGLDVAEFPIAAVSNNVVTIHGIKEADGEIAVGTTSTNDIVLEEVAYTGAAADVSIADAGGLITATDVEGALQELATSSAAGAASKTVYITETAGGSGDVYSKRYGIYQGSTGTSSSPVAGEKLGDIDIPKDMVVESGSVVDIVFKASDNTLHEGSESGTDVTTAIKGSGTATAADAGKYIKLIIANSSSTALYIKATDLVDIYTTEQNASQVQLTIDANNVISAEIVDGSVDTDALGTAAVTTAKIADDAVTAAKIDIAAHTETQTASTDGLALSVTTTDGQVSAVSGSIAANTYESYGSVSTAIAALDSSTDNVTPTADTSLDFLTSVTIADGMISAAKTTTIGFASQQEIANLFA